MDLEARGFIDHIQCRKVSTRLYRFSDTRRLSLGNGWPVRKKNVTEKPESHGQVAATSRNLTGAVAGYITATDWHNTVLMPPTWMISRISMPVTKK